MRHMTPRVLPFALAACLVSLTVPTVAKADDRFWILWERFQHVGNNCPDSVECFQRREFTTRLLESAKPASLYRLFGVMDPHNVTAVAPSQDPDAPKVCNANEAPIGIGFDPFKLPQSIKVEALRGISSVFLDLRSLRAPPGFSSGFGPDLHQKFVQYLEGAGIQVVDEEALAHVPGQPRLNVYFSFTDPDSTCDYEYSVFSSLSQEVLLVRDLRIKISAGVWSYSTGSTAKGHIGNEADAIMRVADALIRDHRQVNPSH